MASLKDIAQEIGVSVSLVSKVLNDRMGTTVVRPELAETIRACAKKRNYRANASAISLLKGRQEAIGVFMHETGLPGSGVSEKMLWGISSEAMQSKLRQYLIFYNSGDDITIYKDIMHQGMLDGLIMCGVTHPEFLDMLVDLNATGLPVTTLHDEPIHPTIPNIGCDQVEVGHIATTHLIEQGCKKIAHIVDSQDRTKGYLNALSDHGMKAHSNLIYDDGTMTYEHTKGAKAARHFLDHKTNFDGLVAQSDEQAIGFINVICEAGYNIPKDIKIIGVDDARYAEFTRIPLTTVAQNCVIRGKQTVELLQEMITGKKVESINIPPTLIPRESTRA